MHDHEAKVWLDMSMTLRDALQTDSPCHGTASKLCAVLYLKMMTAEQQADFSKATGMTFFEIGDVNATAIPLMPLPVHGRPTKPVLRIVRPDP